MQDAVLLLQNARTGDGAALGQLLDRYRTYLKLLARVHIGSRIRSKVGSSDVVQEAFAEAHHNLPLFRGATEAEFVAWLRQILVTRIALVLRQYLGTRARDVRLERELSAQLEESSLMLDRGFVASDTSPSGRAAQREQALRVADALERMPEQYRDVIVGRHLQSLAFAEIAARMGRSVDSVQKLWVRGLAELKRQMGED